MREEKRYKSKTTPEIIVKNISNKAALITQNESIVIIDKQLYNNIGRYMKW